MKGKISKVLSCIIASVFILPFAFSTVSAEATSGVGVDISKTGENTYTLLLYLQKSINVESVDLSVHCSNDITVDSFSVENTDAEGYYSEPDAINSDKALIYTYDLSERDVQYSAYFLNSFTDENNFSVCRISLHTEMLTENTNFTLKYTLTASEASKTAFTVYSIMNTAIINTDTPEAYYAGDIDKSGSVTALDARIALRYCVGLETLSPDKLPFANFNADNSVSASDARLILRASVSLEEAELRSYDISVADGKACEEAENYVYKCRLSDVSFVLAASERTHIYSSKKCTVPSKCIMCNAELAPAAGHTFNENGYCSVCNANADELTDIKNKLAPVFAEIAEYDALANAAAAKNNYAGYIRNTEKATLCIKNAVSICENINGMQYTAEDLSKAYTVRFNAFLECMDENGKIHTTGRSYNIIATAVIESNKYIDYTIAE